jgi:hypothetical protein
VQNADRGANRNRIAVAGQLVSGIFACRIYQLHYLPEQLQFGGFCKTGPNQIYISPSYQMRFKDHVLISDISLRLDSVIKHYEWDLDEIAFSSEESTLSSRWLEILGTKNVGRSTLNSICQDIAIEKCSSAWVYLFSILGVLVTTILAVTGVFFLWVRYITTLKARILHISL